MKRLAAIQAKALVAIAAALFVAWPKAASAQTTEPARAEEPSPLAAETEPQKCLRSFEDAQRRRAEGALRAAREELIACGQAGCPEVVQSQCVAWLRDVEESLPSIVVVAKDEAGRDATGVRVKADGEVVAEALDGRPIPLDPGPRTLRFERAGAAPIEMNIVVVEGKKNREVTVVLAPAKASPRKPKGRPSALPPPVVEPVEPIEGEPSEARGALFYAGLSVGAAGVLAGTLAGVVALTQGAALQNECTGSVCPADKKDELESGTAVAHVSTASFALGGAGLALALVMYLVDRPGDDPSEGSPKAAFSRGALPLAWTGHF